MKRLKLTFKALPLVIIGLSVVGFTDAVYLTIKHYDKSPLKCSLFSGCDVVTTSQYATINGVPISLLGALYYLAVGVFFLFFLLKKEPRWIQVGTALATSGLLTSFVLLYIQLFIIQALCLYCLVSAVSSSLIFLSAIILLFSRRRE